jgi:hypothetical protein
VTAFSWYKKPCVVPAELANNNLIRNSPFIVGVSGHRDLDPQDIARLRGSVTDFVRELKARLPDTELRIIVGMAAGADLLVAQTAVDLGVEVEAVLPMPLAQYAGDFDAQNLAHLERLLARPDVRCVELSLPLHLRNAGGMLDESQRDVMYENLTDTLIRRSSILLALWDGHASKLPGGTADTVLRYLGIRTDENRDDVQIEFVEADAELDAADKLVYWAPALRVSNAAAAPVREPCFLRGIGDNALQMQRHMPVSLARQLEVLNRYNREYVELMSEGKLAEHDSLLAGLPADAPMHDLALLKETDTQYAKADAMAVYYQRRSDRLFGLFGIMTFAMGLAYLIYEKLTESRALLLTYLIVLLTSLSVYYLLHGRHWFAKHLTYRAIAETMRAKFYLRLAGIDHRVDAIEVLSMSGIDRFRGFGWIKYVLSGTESPDIHDVVPGHPDARRSQFVERTWIENQHRYFTAKVARLSRSSRRIKRLKNMVFGLILVVIVVLFAFGESMHQHYIGFGISVKNLLTFCMGFFVILLGVWELHQDKMATRELLWQYGNQLNHFSRARAQLARTTTLDRRNDVLVELAKDSLMESYLWTIHRYHREHEPPAAG